MQSAATRPGRGFAAARAGGARPRLTRSVRVPLGVRSRPTGCRSRRPAAPPRTASPCLWGGAPPRPSGEFRPRLIGRSFAYPFDNTARPSVTPGRRVRGSHPEVRYLSPSVRGRATPSPPSAPSPGGGGGAGSEEDQEDPERYRVRADGPTRWPPRHHRGRARPGSRTERRPPPPEPARTRAGSPSKRWLAAPKLPTKQFRHKLHTKGGGSRVQGAACSPSNCGFARCAGWILTSDLWVMSSADPGHLRHIRCSEIT
jgi:hypothetical protein